MKIDVLRGGNPFVKIMQFPLYVNEVAISNGGGGRVYVPVPDTARYMLVQARKTGNLGGELYMDVKYARPVTNDVDDGQSSFLHYEKKNRGSSDNEQPQNLWYVENIKEITFYGPENLAINVAFFR